MCWVCIPLLYPSSVGEPDFLSSTVQWTRCWNLPSASAPICTKRLVFRGFLHLQELCHILAIMSFHQIYDCWPQGSSECQLGWATSFWPSLQHASPSRVGEPCGTGAWGKGSAMCLVGCSAPSPPPACRSSCPVPMRAGPCQDWGPATLSATICPLLFSISVMFSVWSLQCLAGPGIPAHAHWSGGWTGCCVSFNWMAVTSIRYL